MADAYSKVWFYESFVTVAFDLKGTAIWRKPFTLLALLVICLICSNYQHIA